MAEPGEVTSNSVFGTSNVARKKYDPIYEINITVEGNSVIYIGRLVSFGVNPNLMTVVGVPIKGKSIPKNPEVFLTKEQTFEDTFPIISFNRIRKIA